MKLTENIVLKGRLLETKSENLPEAVLCRVEYPICNVGVLNANKRIYEREVWDHVMANEDFQRKMDQRCLFGHAEHPDGSQSNLECTSHVIFQTRVDEGAKQLFQVMDVVDTPAGRIVDALLRAGCNVGVSTRAEGELEECEDEKFGKYSRVIPESYNYITTDFTADPSTFDMAPVSVKRNVVRQAEAVCHGGATNVGERQFAVAILETLACEGESCDAHQVLQMVKEGVWAMPVAPQQASKLSAIMEEPILAHNAMNVLSSLFGTDEMFAEIQKQDPKSDIRPIIKVHLRNALQDYAEHPERYKEQADRNALLALRGIVDESNSIAGLYDIMIDLRVAEGCIRAERDLAIELLEVKEKANTQLSLERSILIGSVKESLEKPKVVLIEKSSLDDLKQIRKLEKSEKLSESKMHTLKAEVVFLKEAAKTVDEIHATELITLGSTHEKALISEKVRVTEAAVRSFVKQYAKMKVTEFGITLHEAHQALLEDCKSVAQVNDVFEKIVNALRESALHSKVPEDIVIKESVRKSKSKEKDEIVESRVGLAFEGM